MIASSTRAREKRKQEKRKIKNQNIRPTLFFKFYEICAFSYFFQAFSTWDSNFHTFGIQPENHEKRLWHASTGRKIQPRRRNQQTAAMQRDMEEVWNKRCPKYSALRLRVTTAQSQLLHHSKEKKDKTSEIKDQGSRTKDQGSSVVIQRFRLEKSRAASVSIKYD